MLEPVIASPQVVAEPCGPGECPCEGTPWPCPTSGTHRPPVVGLCARRRKLGAMADAQILDLARRDVEGDFPVITPPIRCPHLEVRTFCQAEARYCALGKGESPGIVEVHDCDACQAGRIRVGILSAGCYTGGAEIWIRTMLGHLDPARFACSGIAIVFDQHIDPVMRAEFATFGPVAAGPAACERLWSDSDVVIIWGVPAWEQRIPDRPRRARVILVSHGVGDWTARVFGEPDRADAWAAVSVAALDPIPESHKARAVVIPNGIDLARLEPAPGARASIRARFGVSGDQRLVLYLGRLSEEKNPRAFLEGAAECERRWPGRFAFVAVGDGLGFAHERAWAARHAPRVRFAGVQRRPGNYLAASDHLVMPSHEEADSLALLEAWAAGVPVCSTPVGRIRDPAYAGFVRPLTIRPSGADIADALDHDASMTSEVARRVEEAREVARREHSAEAMARRWGDLLGTL